VLWRGRVQGEPANQGSPGRMTVNVLPTSTRLVGVGRTDVQVRLFGLMDCLSVCQFVCPQCNSEQMIQQCSNLVQGMTLGYPRRNMVSGLKGQGHRVSKCILFFSLVCPSLIQK